MDIDNDPIVSGKRFLVCEERDRLAQQFIKGARSVLQLAGTTGPSELRDNLDRALADWFVHPYLSAQTAILALNLRYHCLRSTYTEAWEESKAVLFKSPKIPAS
jgi:hypothetical protein